MKEFFKRIIGPNLLFLIKKYLFNTIDEIFVIKKYFEGNKISNGVMIDVGVHYGSSCIPFLEDGWTVVGFEPDNNNRAEAYKRIPVDSNIEIFDFALSNEPGVMEFYTSSLSTGISSLNNFHDSHTVSQTVQVKTLRSVLEKLNIQSVNLLKIDTEGYDLKVLEGLKFDDRLNIDIIICEYEDRKTMKLQYSVLDMIDFLKNVGYEVIVCEWEPIEEYGKSHRFRRAIQYPCDIDGDSWGNLIAYKKPDFLDFALRRLN